MPACPHCVHELVVCLPLLSPPQWGEWPLTPFPPALLYFPQTQRVPTSKTKFANKTLCHWFRQTNHLHDKRICPPCPHESSQHPVLQIRSLPPSEEESNCNGMGTHAFRLTHRLVRPPNSSPGKINNPPPPKNDGGKAGFQPEVAPPPFPPSPQAPPTVSCF